MLFLRARYYEPGTGRFVTRDPWEGDYFQPETLLRNYLYVLNNPVNAADLSGLYDGKKVHKDLTESLVSEIAKSYGVETVCGQNVSKIISKYNKHVDDSVVLGSVFEGVGTYGCRRCHFCNWADTTRHVEDAINPSTYLGPSYFGAVLHQVQDYFSHWGEGYGEEGHATHTIRAGAKTGGRSKELLDDFFEDGHWEGWGPNEEHSEDEVRRFLGRTNPGASIDSLDRDGLIDLYLRKDQGRDLTMRDYFGFDPDKYVPGSSRDNLMEWFARYYIKGFMESILADPCAADCDDDVDAIKELLTE